MTTIKSYTDLQQSKKLAKILPLESADMSYYKLKEASEGCYHILVDNGEHYDETGTLDVIPCWSLASLLEQIPYEVCDDEGNSAYLQMDKEDDVYQLVYTDPYENLESIATNRCEHFVDACYEMIIKLNGLKML